MSRVEELISRYFDGLLSEAEEEELGAVLKESAEARSLLASYMRLEGASAQLAGADALEAVTPPPRRIHRRATRPAPLGGTAVWFGALAAAALLVGIIIALGSSSTDAPPRPRVDTAKAADPAVPNPPAPPEVPPAKPAPQAPPIPSVPGKPKEKIDRRLRETVVRTEPEDSPRPTPRPHKPRATQVQMARLEAVRGDVRIVAGNKSNPAQAGQGIPPGHGLLALGTATVLFTDGTRLEVGPETRISDLRFAGGKALRLDRGTITAEVAPQPKGAPFVLTTPHGEAEVLGTTLRLVADSSATTLVVSTGKVRLTRTRDRRRVDVAAGHYAVAAPRIRMVARRIDPSKARAPYPPSAQLGSMTWDPARRVQLAPQSDLWPVTWAADGNLYTSWGNGGGFGGNQTDGRVAMGIARIEGGPTSFKAVNVNGGKNPENPSSFPGRGKTGGMLAVNGKIYLWQNTENPPWPDNPQQLVWSEDFGVTWNRANWTFPAGAGNFKPTSFLNTGRDYAGARDGYVYLYGRNQTAPAPGRDAILARVPKNLLEDQNAYEFYAGLDEDGKPLWSGNLADRRPFFIDPRGVQTVHVVFNARLRRYLMTVCRGNGGELGLFDAPEPWGPWTTVAYDDNWLGADTPKGIGLVFNFANKWTSSDGLTMWLVYSSVGTQSFNLVKGQLSRLR